MQSARTRAALQEKNQGDARANDYTPRGAAGAASGVKPPAAGAQQSPRMKTTPAPQHGPRAAAPAASSPHYSAAVAQGKDIGAEARGPWAEPGSQRMRAAAAATRGAQHAGQPAPGAAPAPSTVKHPDSAGRTDKRPHHTAKEGLAGSVLAGAGCQAQQPGSVTRGDSSPDYSAVPKAKAADAVPPAPWVHLPDGVPSGDSGPDYSARTGKGAAEPHPELDLGARARPGSAAGTCGSCAGAAEALAALAQGMQGLQASSRQMLPEVKGEVRALRDHSASLEGHVRQLGAEVARLAELFHSDGAHSSPSEIHCCWPSGPSCMPSEMAQPLV